MEMRKLLMDTLCQQGLFIVVELLLGYSHCVKEMESIV